MRKKLVVGFLFVLVCSILGLPVIGQDSSFSVETLTIDNQPIYDMNVSPDGRIAAVYAGRIALAVLNVPVAEYVVEKSLLPIRLIDLTTGEELTPITGPTDYVAGIAFTPDSTQLATYHRNGDIFLWDVESGDMIHHLTALLGEAQIAFLPDGHTLVVHMQLNRISQFLLWDTQTGTMNQVWRTPYSSFGDIRFTMMPEGLDYIYVAFRVSPDGNWLATATGNGELVLWDTTTLEQTIVQPRAPEDRLMQFNIRGFAFSADNQTLVYHDTNTDQTTLWDVTTQSPTATLDFGSRFLALSPDQTALAWATRTEIWFADLSGGNEPVKVMDFPEDLRVFEPTVTFISDGEQIVVGGFQTDDDAGANSLFVITLE